MDLYDSDWAALRNAIMTIAVQHGPVRLSSGQWADYYIDLRRITLDGALAPYVGRVMLEMTSGWAFEAVGGLTLGADPVAMAMLYANAATWPWVPLNVFVVRKESKPHGLHRRIEGPDVAGRRVVVVEDTSTTGNSVLTAVAALQVAGAEVAGVAALVDRGAGLAVRAAGLEYRAAYQLTDLGLE